MAVIGGLQLKQLSMRQDDPQLVVQLVEQPAQFGAAPDRTREGVRQMRR